MSHEDQKQRLDSYSRRLFIQRAGLLTGMITLGGGTYLLNPKAASAATPIRIGIATDLSGPISFAGIPNANVAKMLVEDMNASGGLLGRPLQLVVVDTASNEQVAIPRVRKLVSEDKVDVVLGGITSSMRNAIKGPILGEGKTIYIYPQLYEGRECTPYLYCTGPTPAQQCDTFIPWLIENGGKRFYLPSAAFEWPHGLNQYARKVIGQSGGEIVGEEYFAIDRSDYTSTVQSIMSNSVNVVFNTTIPPGITSFFHQLYEAGFIQNGGRLACVYYDENAINITPANEVEGLASCLDYFKAVNDAYGNKLQERYTSLYGTSNPFTAGSASTGMHRGIRLWAAAVIRAQTTSREAVATALDNAALLDGPGGGCQMVPGTHHLKMNMYIAVAKNGSFELVSKSSGPVAPGECG